MKRCLPAPLVLLALAAPAAAQTTIDFELAGPCAFAAQVALSNEYAGLGVSFSGPAAGDGGCVLDQCGNFGVNALSGTNFLAFNDFAGSLTGTPTGPETIKFAGTVTKVSIWVAGGDAVGTFQLDAYAGAVLVDSDVVAAQGWQQLAVSGAGITHVVLDEVGNDAHWVADDLVFGGSCAKVFCDTNPDNAADLDISNCVCTLGTAVLLLTNAPPNQFGYPLVGAGSVTFTDPPGAVGDLCLTGAPIGRYDKDAGFTDAAGNAKVDVLNAISGGGGGNIPTIGGNLCVPPNQTWNFQWWHRDGMNPSKFSKAITVPFL